MPLPSVWIVYFIAGGGCLTGESEPSRAAARFWFIRSDAPPTGYERLSFNPYLVRLFVVQLKRGYINPYAEKGHIGAGIRRDDNRRLRVDIAIRAIASEFPIPWQSHFRAKKLRDVIHTFSRSLSEHKSAINPRFLGIKSHQPRFIAAECSCSWPLNQNENSKEEMSHLQVTQSTSPESESEMLCREEPDGFCQDSWVRVRVALWIKIGEELLEVLLWNRYSMLPGLHLIFLGKVLQIGKGIDGLVGTHWKSSPLMNSGRIGQL